MMGFAYVKLKNGEVGWIMRMDDKTCRFMTARKGAEYNLQVCYGNGRKGDVETVIMASVFGSHPKDVRTISKKDIEKVLR